MASPAFDEYVSDPAKPVTYRPRPIRPTYATDSTWRRWLVDDQRFASDRTDVLLEGARGARQERLEACAAALQEGLERRGKPAAVELSVRTDLAAAAVDVVLATR